MKILAIRLQNLASLAGQHELDFTQGALFEAGLFAITGPTGAGKSTLLDALCLALFGSTPRLRAAPNRESSTPDIDGEQLITADPRTLLRRGEASGFAEVDFEGRDGHHYRARWAVRRARNKPEGKLQGAEQSLIELPGERVITAQKREFERLLPDKLGLSFDQFTRAVLLAQAEFSAFLKANDNERSELLEKLTDTAIYSRISIEAYQRTKTISDEIKRLEARLGGQAPASPEQRTILEKAAQTAEDAWQALQAEAETLQQRRAWFTQDKHLSDSWQQAEDARQHAERHHAVLAEQRQLGAWLEALAPQRHAFEQHQTQQRALEQATAKHAEIVAALQKANACHDRQQHAFIQAEASVQQARATRQQAQPVLDQTSEQEQRYRYLNQELEQLAAQQREAERHHHQARQALKAKGQQRDQHQRELDALQQRLGEHSSPEQHRQALQAAQDAARERVNALGDARQAWQQWQRLAERLVSARQRQEQDQAQLNAIITGGRQAKTHLEQAETHDRQLRDSIERLRAVRSASVEKLREQLHDNAPCPVCGSLDHPYVDAPPPSPARELLEQTEREENRQLEQARHQLDTAHSAYQDLTARYKALKAQIDQRAAALTQDEQALAQASQALEDLTLGADLLAQPEPARLPWLNEQLEVVTRQRDERQQALAQFDRDQQNLTPLRNAVQTLDVELGRLDSEATHYHRQHEQLTAALAPKQAERDSLQTALRQTLGAHERVADWRTALDRDVDAAEHGLHATREALTQAQSECQQLTQQHDYLQASMSEQQQTLAALDATLQQWHATHPDIDAATLERLLGMDEQARQALKETLAQADQAVRDSRLRASERLNALQAHRRAHLDAALFDDAEACMAHMATLEQALIAEEQALVPRQQATQQARDDALHALKNDDRLRRDARALESELDAARAEQRRWGRLSLLIGAADGKAFRRIAQAYNLERLVEHANLHLKSLARRYRLARGGSELGLLVIDTEMGDEQRSVHSLSGGETFLVSLALALGLASMASNQLAIETLFIDEGFGSLDPQSLHLAMDALDGLQAQGRKVGVISHVQEMHERIPVQIKVKPLGNGASTLEVAH